MHRTFSTRTRVRFAETDASGIVYYNNYFVYFEVGRIEMFRELGLPYDWRIPIAETHCRFRASARFDELLEVHSFVEEVRSKGFRIGHRVHRVDGPDEGLALLAEGYTAMVHVGEDRRPRLLPTEFRAALDAALAGVDSSRIE
ncbi:MAG: acyl-CoA thioesterase [Deltaproteobacteria bacterium]|nr:acyl-CoA thioesterase [Deltaproteobacteria bacterium]